MSPSKHLLEFADYFGVSERLAPHMHFLLEDFAELGSEPGLIAEWLAGHGVDSSSRVLDLGCGKGAVAVAVARRTGAEVLGVDLYEPFVRAAVSRADDEGVLARCRFEIGDLRAYVEEPADHDAVLFVSVGVALGDFAETIGAIRHLVRPGGVMVVDDAFRKSDDTGEIDVRHYEDTPTLDQARAQLASCGDEIVKEHILSLQEIRSQNQRYTGWIESRAAELRSREPDLCEEIDAYLRIERAEVELLESQLECATWMIRRK